MTEETRGVSKEHGPGGVLVTLLEPEFGREIALRMPYALAGGAALLVAIYGFFRLRL